MCGSDFMTKHNAILTDIKHMQDIYSSAVNTTVIQKVRHDQLINNTIQKSLLILPSDPGADREFFKGGWGLRRKNL